MLGIKHCISGHFLVIYRINYLPLIQLSNILVVIPLVSSPFHLIPRDYDYFIKNTSQMASCCHQPALLAVRFS